MKTKHFLSFTAMLCISLFFSCTEVQRDNPYDEKGINYKGEELSSSSAQTQIIYGDTVDYNGEKYATVEIVTQTWMARNMDYNASGSKCYDGKDSYCSLYGRLYTWTTAKTICPSGWHLPSDNEWNALITAVGISTAATKLKATKGWKNNENGKDNFGFSALPGGKNTTGSGYDNNFLNAGSEGYWWSSSEEGSFYAHYWNMTAGSGSPVVSYNTADKDRNLFSVRCVKN